MTAIGIYLQATWHPMSSVIRSLLSLTGQSCRTSIKELYLRSSDLINVTLQNCIMRRTLLILQMASPSRLQDYSQDGIPTLFAERCIMTIRPTSFLSPSCTIHHPIIGVATVLTGDVSL